VKDAAVPAHPSASRRDPVATRRLWAERLDRFRRANQTVAEFCTAEGISAPSFYVWKRTLAGEAKSPNPVTPTLVPIRLTPSPAGPPIELLFPSGTVLRFPADTRPEVIAAVVHAVEGRPC
jgi:transposase